ncbi:hypothetical protein A2415_03955 [candidate division WWE3 bacterium RIFOXYC1_FULL_39_7]|uniref:Endolytic murein transglycosylase n=2 Tax=Katanobacteria TaxID=422282 RepID=A0A1F4X988_UNCKA|nr:MAG: hypothetical protein A2415_03955 [candidate division WWE3 bacterium RIFOXYC1_FULL_39_7]OGC78238.1 MAG: hypothetical protein A2619_02750 [candidate division WWE3 bacterium RIFOXYD1_FULL_39_9]
MPEPLDPEKFHIITDKKKFKVMLISILLMLLVLPPIFLIYYRFSINRPSQIDKEITFEIRDGQSISETAQLLSREGAVNSEFLFTLYVFLNNYDKNIQAGVYKIPAGTSIVRLVSMFQHGVNDVTITFLEGWRVEEFAREASKNLDKIDYTDFLNLASGQEGYLFPDTYIVNKDINEDGLLELLSTTFENKTKDELSVEKLKAAGLTKEEAVIFASILEREVYKEEDRPVVAGILIKRYREGMKIDADATTQYAVAQQKICGEIQKASCIPPMEDFYELDWWPSELTIEDINNSSPYNTRKNVGLPPAPISNPGLESIRAVLNYQNTGFYYYLTDKFGNAYYATTLEEHNANVAKYLTD